MFVNLYYYFDYELIPKNIMKKYHIHVFDERIYTHCFETAGDAKRFIEDIMEPYDVFKELTKCL